MANLNFPWIFIGEKLLISRQKVLSSFSNLTIKISVSRFNKTFSSSIIIFCNVTDIFCEIYKKCSKYIYKLFLVLIVAIESNIKNWTDVNSVLPPLRERVNVTIFNLIFQDGIDTDIFPTNAGERSISWAKSWNDVKDRCNKSILVPNRRAIESWPFERETTKEECIERNQIDTKRRGEVSSI